MRVTIALHHPDDIECKVTIYAKLSDLERLHSLTESRIYPAWVFADALADAIRRARSAYQGEAAPVGVESERRSA